MQEQSPFQTDTSRVSQVGTLSTTCLPMPHPDWPALPLSNWRDTYATLHRWTQIVGKIRLARMPWINHSWHVPLYVTSRGLTTGPMPHGTRTFEIAFDFCAHRVLVDVSDGAQRAFALEPMSVAAFYHRVQQTLSDLDLNTPIWPVPVEIAEDVAAFPDDDQHASYDADAAHRLWQILLQTDRVFTDFRARFVGKVSPVHFFWGAFDLAVTRFSGRTAPPHPGGAPKLADRVMREAYSHEVSSAGFWPGEGLGEPAFYSYAYPEPDGYSNADVRPDAAYYHADLGEFVLPYSAVRSAADPDATLLTFLESTYTAAADLSDWDRAALEAHDLPPV